MLAGHAAALAPAGGRRMSRHGRAREASRLQRRLEALNDARELAEGVLPDDALRRSPPRVWSGPARGGPFPPDHTVVGFFGATGSGKSTLFNAVNGAEIATAAARRPTTSEPLASVWGADGSEALLDWLDVRQRHHAAPVDGLRRRIQRASSSLTCRTSIRPGPQTARPCSAWWAWWTSWSGCWIRRSTPTPPSTTTSWRPLASHGAVTLVVLNQIDRLPEADVQPVLESLKGILARDGLGKVQVLGGLRPDRCRSGQGPGSHPPGGCRGRQPCRCGCRPMSPGRRPGCWTPPGHGEPAGVKSGTEARLAEELAVAANVPLVVDAVAASVQAGVHPAHGLAGNAVAGPLPA